MNRKETLDTAAKCVLGDREQDYGSPESNFALIGKLWTDYLNIIGVKINAQDVASMMMLMKLARIRNGGGTGDSYVDIAGYAACGAEIYSYMVTQQVGKIYDGNHNLVATISHEQNKLKTEEKK